MKFHAVKYCFFLLAFLLLANAVSAQEDDDIARQAVPAYTGLVNDFAGILSASDKNILEQKLRTYEDSTSTQIVIAIESSLNGRSQFDRSMDFARGWKIGSKDKNNGVLLYVAMDEKKISIRTSNEVMARITGGEADELIRNVMAPEMRKQNYFAAFDNATTAIMEMLAGQFQAGKKPGKDTVPGWVFFVAIFIILTIISIINNRRFGRGFRSGGPFWFPTGGWGGNNWGGGGWGSGGGGGWGGMGGGGGFDGGGSDGGW